MKIKEFPKEIQELCDKRRLEDNPSFTINHNTPLTSYFSFGDTPEFRIDREFWHKINFGKYDEFYKLYPIETVEYNNDNTYKCKINGKNYEVIIREVIDN